MLSPPSPSNNQLKWSLYLTLLALRFFGAIYSQTGYVHPDEFFQGGQELFFGQQLEDTSPVSGDPIQLQHEYAVKNVPWEFEPNNALRSIVCPAFMTLLPLRVYVAAKSFVAPSTTEPCHGSYFRHQSPMYESFLWTPSLNELSGKEILIIPRLFMTILSLIFLDGSLWILVICNEQRKELKESPNKWTSANSRIPRHRTLSYVLSYAYQFGPPEEVIALASSWPCLVFGIRPFTNTLEAMILSFLLVVVNLDFSERIGIRQSNGFLRSSPACIGITCSIGIFVRFTFAFFALPAVVTHLWFRWKQRGSKLRSIVYDGAWLGSAFLLTSTFFIVMDSAYYSWQAQNGGLAEEHSLRDMLRYIAPVNAFLYNSKATNLAEHGLHPRITHAVVNMPMLFGPLALIGYASVARNVYNGGDNNNNLQQRLMQITCHLVILSGLLVLSCAPHQEPRFLLPCVVPLILLYGKEAVGADTATSDERLSKQSKTTILTLFWVIFNFILYTFFGWLHQGGLIDSLLHTPATTDKSSSHAVYIYYKTYMPPVFLARAGPSKPLLSSPSQCLNDLADTRDDACSSNALKSNENECKASSSQQNKKTLVLDLQGNDSRILLKVLQKYLPCSHMNGEENNPLRIYLITPFSVAQSLLNEDERANTFEQGFIWEGYSFRKDYASPYVHVSTEDWPMWSGSIMKLLSQLEVGVYAVACK
ncbi:hypothetical protein HJC23_000426 [Cyclotella cryptica]|uniref:Mannosyltransferase n=1 Tax=Cyclotella cryptica TaxID=29204 RepID=A0ABD3Q9U2_9STRA|eukprot:CCRYP_007162-RA/>CCRYP_007162-RA protein AED:0.28 eAED:0.28 QI:72/-1/1/1/-1/1/1/1133/703